MADTGLPLNVPFPESTDLVRDGAAAIQAVAEVLNAPPGAFRYAGTRYFEVSGDFLKADPLGTGDIGLRAIRVRMVGGGGGGGATRSTVSASNPLAAGSGGGGGYAEAFITDIAGLASTVAVAVGAAGAGATGTGNPGGTGGTTSFGVTIVAASGGFGGGGGAALAGSQIRPSGRGGEGTHGDLLLNGGPGTQGAFGTLDGHGGTGGSSTFSGGAHGVFASSAGNNGNAAFGFGGGGSGSFRKDGTVLYSGGSGSPGICIVDCFV